MRTGVAEWRRGFRTAGKWLFAVGVAAALAVVGLGLGSHGQQISLPGRIPDLGVSQSDPAAQGYFGLGLTDLQGQEPQLDLGLTFGRPAGTRISAEGAGHIRVGKKQYALSINRGEGLDIATSNGKQLYAGALHGSLNTEAGSVPAVLTVLHQADSGETVVNVTVGTVGKAVFLAFGRPFLTREQIESLAPAP